MELILGALACLWGWETLVGLLPFSIPGRLAPLLLVLLAYGILHLHGILLLAAAVAGAVALARKFLGIESMLPWNFPWTDIRMVLNPPRRRSRVNPGTHGRPPGTIGRRIPRL